MIYEPPRTLAREVTPDLLYKSDISRRRCVEMEAMNFSGNKGQYSEISSPATLFSSRLQSHVNELYVKYRGCQPIPCNGIISYRIERLDCCVCMEQRKTTIVCVWRVTNSLSRLDTRRSQCEGFARRTKMDTRKFH